MRQLLLQNKIKALNFVQLISRCFRETPEGQEDPLRARMWYPDVEPSFSFNIIPDKAQLVKYVLHAKHRRIDCKTDKVVDLLGDEQFEEVLAQAQKFLSMADCPLLSSEGGH